MRLTLRTRLALLYGGVVALTATAFAVVAYFTVSNELYQNLDRSLARAASSLLVVIKNQQQEAQRPLMRVKRSRRSEEASKNIFAFLERSSMRDFVGPIPVPDSILGEREDPVWTAVYEHVLLNSSTFVLQVSVPSGDVVWRSDNLLEDSLPRFEYFKERGVRVIDDRIYTDYTVRGTRYRLVITKADMAEVAAAYPAEEVDATLRGLFALMLWAIPVVIVLSVLAGWFLAKRALSPVDLITRSARRITAERLADRLPVLQTNDEIARLTDTLNEMIARLERSFEQVRQFTSDASHELKTPLAILMGELEIALRRPIADDEIRRTLESCLEEVDRLNNVVQGLLELSRAESGQVQIEMRPVDLSALLKDICEDIEILAEPKQISVTTSIASYMMVNGDKTRLHQALLNVIENAVKYTPRGGRVKVTLTSDPRRALIRVEDTGQGIPAEQLPKIYDRFFRVDKARSQDVQGTGLGLSIVRWIVESHGGSIMASSEVGVGTTFVIALPLA